MQVIRKLSEYTKLLPYTHTTVSYIAFAFYFFYFKADVKSRQASNFYLQRLLLQHLELIAFRLSILLLAFNIFAYGRGDSENDIDIVTQKTCSLL